jgi:inner membrane transporter RhtA
VLGLAAVFAVMNVSLYTAIDRIGLGLAVTLEFLGPLAVALLGSRRLLDLLCALAAAPAVVLLTRPQAATDYLGVGLGLLAAVCWACYILLNRVVGRELPGATGSAAAAGASALVYVPVGVVVLWHHPPTLAAAAYAVVAGVLSSAVPFLVDLLALRRVPAQFFGVFMSVNPVLAALVGLVVLHQHLIPVDWLAIAVIVTANTVAISVGVRRDVVPEGRSNDAADHSPVPVGRCEVVHGVPAAPLTPPFGRVSADGERRSSRATQ